MEYERCALFRVKMTEELESSEGDDGVARNVVLSYPEWQVSLCVCVFYCEIPFFRLALLQLNPLAKELCLQCESINSVACIVQ